MKRTRSATVCASASRIGRLGRPEEVADLAVYLAADESGFMNGAALPIDRGWTGA
jgi:NAD(P)-dependent dehydrogenase (short-subunit alcohol dehydrogenase family)